jgi:hypothetical protein
MVRKEVAIHLLASSLIRGIMAEAARVGDAEPRALSFKRSLHAVRSFEAEHLYDRADRGGPAAVAGLDREVARGGPPGPLRAAGGEAAADAVRAAEDPDEGGQT